MMPEDARDLTYPGGQVRLYLDAPLKPGAEVSADEGQTHYLLHVMRAKEGDRVRLFNGRDGEFLAVVAKAAKRAVKLVCEKQIRAQSAEPDVWLLFAPIKRAPIDSLVERRRSWASQGFSPSSRGARSPRASISIACARTPSKPPNNRIV